MRILGIDPGSSVTGYGVVEGSGSKVVYVAHGTIRTRAKQPLAERLAAIQRELRLAIVENRPDRAIVERVFVSVNPRSALVLGHARGAILATLGGEGVPVDELAAREIKQAVTGVGGADKLQVQTMVARLLNLQSRPPQDAADALAAAIARVQMGRLAGLGVGKRRTRRNLVPRAAP